MANEGELPDLDMKMPSLDLELPEPTLSLDLPDLGTDAPADMPSVTPAPAAVSPAGKPAAKPAGKPKKEKVKKEKKVRVKAPRGPPGAMLPIVQGLLCVFLLAVLIAFMYLLEVPINQVPDLSLTTYVQSLWLIVGCFLVVALLQDIKMALIFTGMDIVMLLTIFPTLLVLLNTPMNPLYFYAMGMILLQIVIAIPLSVISARNQAAKNSAPAGAGAPPAKPTGPTP